MYSIRQLIKSHGFSPLIYNVYSTALLKKTNSENSGGGFVRSDRFYIYIDAKNSGGGSVKGRDRFYILLMLKILGVAL